MQNSNDNFYRNRKKNSTTYMKGQKTTNSQIKSENNKVRGTAGPNFKIYHKPTITKTIWYWQRD